MKDKFYSVFAEHLSGFTTMKRNLGFKYRAGEETLARFDRLACELDVDEPVVTKAIYDKWMGLSPYESELSKYHRAVCLNQFLSYFRDLGLKAYSGELPKYPGCRFIPHIYTHDEMERIFEACDGLRMRIRNPFSPIPSLPCLIRMLYATGIRIGEAVSLPEKNVDLDNNRILLEKTKNGRERLIPIDGSLASVCREYLDHKHRLFGTGHRAGSLFFTSLAGEGLKRGTVERRFGEILRKAGIPSQGARKGPRLHDLRHTFACHSFVRLAEEGVDLYCSWPYLASYLGHRSLESTERYVRLTASLYPDLLKDGHTMYMGVIPNEKEKDDGKGL
jgi:integrase